MRKLLATLVAVCGLFLAQHAHAANCPSYPYTLTNGQVADANQVMANFNSILNCGNNNLAHNGANVDITSLNALSTPLSVPQGGTGAGTFTAHGVMIGEGSSGLGVTGVGLSGQVLFGNTGADPSWAQPQCSNLLSVGQGCSLNIGQAASTLAAGNDSRFGGPTPNTQNTNYSFALSDAGGAVIHFTGSGHTFTIPANASVAFPVFTKIDVVVACGSGNVTLAITSDTLTWIPNGVSGSRTIAACSEVTLTKINTTVWYVVGVGIS